MKLTNRKLILIVALILVIAIAATAIVWCYQPVGHHVEVTIDGELFGKYSLGTERTVVIGPEDGSWHNTLEIKDGTANMVEADCPTQLCVLFPPLSENELGIIYCAPHGVVVTLTE